MFQLETPDTPEEAIVNYLPIENMPVAFRQTFYFQGTYWDLIKTEEQVKQWMDLNDVDDEDKVLTGVCCTEMQWMAEIDHEMPVYCPRDQRYRKLGVWLQDWGFPLAPESPNGVDDFPELPDEDDEHTIGTIDTWTVSSSDESDLLMEQFLAPDALTEAEEMTLAEAAHRLLELTEWSEDDLVMDFASEDQ